MVNIIIIVAGIAVVAYLLGIILEKNGIAACFSAVGFVAWIGFAYMVTEYVPQREVQVVLYGFSVFPLMNAIYRYTKWIMELREEANWQFLQERLGLIREASTAATTDAQFPLDSQQAACKRLLQLIFKEDLPRLVTKPDNDN